MAQTYHTIDAIAAVFAQNLQIDSQSAETVVLDGIPSTGLRNISGTITCYSGSISAVKLYGSMDGINYVAISGFSSFTVSASNTGHGEVAANWKFMRLTTTGSATIDAHLIASQ